MRIQQEHKIRVLYKSGNSHEFWVTEFKIANGVYTWKASVAGKDAIWLGADCIEAVYQVGTRRRLRFN